MRGRGMVTVGVLNSTPAPAAMTSLFRQCTCMSPLMRSYSSQVPSAKRTCRLSGSGVGGGSDKDQGAPSTKPVSRPMGKNRHNTCSPRSGSHQSLSRRVLRAKTGSS